MLLGVQDRSQPAHEAHHLHECPSNTIPSRPTSSFTHTHNSAHTSGSRLSKDHKRSEDRSATKPDISLKLGKNGKLAPEERKCRFDNHLCMFCGQSGHVVKDCPRY